MYLAFDPKFYTYLQAMRRCENVRCTHLCCNVGVLLPVPVAVVGVDVVAAHDPVHRLQHHAAVVVRDHVGVPGQYYQSGTAIIILSVELDSNLPHFSYFSTVLAMFCVFA